MDFLTSIDDASLRRLRHVSARSHPLPVTPVPEDSPNYVTYSFPTVLQLFPELQLSTLVVRDTYHEPGTQQDGFGDEASYEMVEDLIKSDGFKELIYISGSDSFMNTNEFVTIPAKYPANGAEKFVETTRRDPQPSTWDKLIKERDGTASGARVEMFRHTKDGRVPLKSEFERSKKPSGVESRVVVPNTEFPTPSGVEDRGRREAIEIRIKRGEGADYVQTGQKCGREEGWLHELFRLVTWADIKKQGMIVEVRNEDIAVHLSN